MSVLTDAAIAANAHLEKVVPEAVEVNGVQMWYWSAIYDAFMAGAAYQREATDAETPNPPATTKGDGR